MYLMSFGIFRLLNFHHYGSMSFLSVGQSRHSGLSNTRAGVTDCLEGFSEQKAFSFKTRTVPVSIMRLSADIVSLMGR